MGKKKQGSKSKNKAKKNKNKNKESENAELLTNGIKLIGERYLPGASLLLDGKIVEGSIHAAFGIGARLIFGLPGAVVLAADSYSKSTTGKGLWSHLTESDKKEKQKA